MVIRETNLADLWAAFYLLHRGKVRDIYDTGDGLLLMVATDRISAFDAVLPTAIPQKGLVLSRLSAFWFRKTAHIMPNHFIALADEPEPLKDLVHSRFLDSLPDSIARQAMVVRWFERISVECVVRGYLAGSAWAEYQGQGTVHGQSMPRGMREGERLPHPVFTPTTKAEEGHDQPLSLAQLDAMIGEKLAKELLTKSVAIYQFAHDYALTRNIILADTKFEFGLDHGSIILIDELLTPDSSRFWEASAYRPGQSQPNYDKQFVRDWLNSTGWDHEPPAPELPAEIVEKTSQRYKEAYFRLTGETLPE